MEIRWILLILGSISLFAFFLVLDHLLKFVAYHELMGGEAS